MHVTKHVWELMAAAVFAAAFISGNAWADDILELETVELIEDAELDNDVPGERFSDRLMHAQIAESTSPNLETGDIIGEISSVRVSGNGGRLQRVSMAYRGSASQDIVVRYRGVAINALSDASADLSLIPASLLDSVQIYNGGASIASGALGGLVELNPREMSEPLEGSISVSSLRDFSLFGRGALVRDQWMINGAVFGDLSPGSFHFIDEQGMLHQRMHNGAMRVGAQVDGKYIGSIAEVSAFSLFSRIERDEAGLSEQPIRFERAEQNLFLSLTGIDAQFEPVQLGEAFSQFRATASHRALGSQYENPTALIGGRGTHTEYDENRTQIRVSGEFVLPQYSRTVIDLGYDYQNVRFRYDGGLSVAEKREDHLGHLSVLEHLSFWDDRFQMAIGMGLDWKTGEKLLYSPYINFRLLPHETVEIWGSAGMGERYPSFDEMYYRTEYMRGNADLKKQRSVLNEIGIAYHPGDWLSVSISGFYHIYQDLIRFLPVTSYLYEARNMPGAKSRGFNAVMKSQPWRGLLIKADYTFADARTDMGYPMPTSAKHHFSGMIGWEDDQFQLLFKAGWISEVPRTLLGTSVIHPKLRLDLSGSMNIYRGLSMWFSLENLLNEMRGEDFVQHPLPGRHIFIGLAYR